MNNTISSLACLAGERISLDIIVEGAVTGLASTEMHQMFTKLITGKEKRN